MKVHEEVKMRGGEKLIEEGSGSEGAGSEGRTRDRAVRGKMRWGEGRNMPEVATDRDRPTISITVSAAWRKVFRARGGMMRQNWPTQRERLPVGGV